MVKFIAGATPATPRRIKTFNTGSLGLQDPDQLKRNLEEIAPREFGVLESAALFLPAVVSQFADTASASVGFTEKGDLNDAFLSDIPRLKNFSDQHQGALDIGVAVGDILLTGFVATRILKTGSAINKALRRIPGGRVIADLEANRKITGSRVNALDRAVAAQTGSTGAEAALADVVIFGVRTQGRDKFANAARRASVLKNVTEGVIVEAQLGVIANENDFLFTDSTTTNVAMAALGIAIPGFIGNLSANFEMRRFLNSDAINRIAADAVDRGGFRRTIENPIAGTVDKTTGSFKVGDVEIEGITTNGAASDLATAHLLARDANLTAKQGTERVGLKLQETQRRVANTDEDIAIRLIDRILGAEVVGLKAGSTPLGNDSFARAAQHARAITKVDPTAFLGVEHAVLLKDGDDVAAIVASIGKGLDVTEAKARKALKGKNVSKADAEKLQQTLRQVEFGRTLEPQVARNMEMVPVSEAQAAGKGFTGSIAVSKTEGLTAWQVAGTKAGKALAFTDDGKVVLPAGVKDVSELSLADAQGVFRAVDHALTAISTRANPKLLVAKDANWIELDFAEELIRRTNGRAEVSFPQGVDREVAIVESLAQKKDLMAKLTGGDAIDRTGLSPNQLILREQLNLPRRKSFERGADGEDKTGIDRLFAGAKNGDAIRALDEAAIKQTLGEFREATDLIKFTSDEVDLLGTSFKLGVDQSSGVGRPIADFLVMKRPIGNTAFSRDFLEVRLAGRQAAIYASLISDTSGVAVSKTAKEILSSADYQAAVRSQDLSELQLQGSLPGQGNRSVQTTVQFADFAHRDSPVLLAAARVHDSASRALKAAFKKLIETKQKRLADRSVSEVMASLRNPKNLKSSQLLNQFISARRGWELSGKFSEVGDGTKRFLLKDTLQNREQWQRLFSVNMPKRAALPFARRTAQEAIQEVHLDQLAFDGLEAMQVLAEGSRAEMNTILKSNGLGELGKVEFHVPARDFKNQSVNFIMDGNGKVVQIVSGNTPAELNKALRILEDDPTSLVNRNGYKTISQDAVEQHQGIWDRAQNGFRNPNVPVVQTGTTSKGASLSPFIETNAWEDSLRQYQGQYDQVAGDLVETLFKNQLRAAKGRAAVARTTKRNRFTSNEIQERNIHDIYSNVLQGRNALNDKGSSVGRVYSLFESLIDDKLVKFDRTFQALNPFTGNRAATRQFEELSKSIEDKMPFRDVQEFLEQRLGTKTPLTVKKITGKMNQVTASLVLRWGEVAHPILNLTGMINTAPAVIRQFTQRKGEPFADYTRRVGPYAHIYQLRDGQAVSSLDMGKIMHRAMKRTGKGQKGMTKEEWDIAKNRGYLDQEVAEFHNQYEALTLREAGFGAFFDKADKWAGVLSDKSEQFARSYFLNVGLEVADLVGIKGAGNRINFANDIANRGIANYNPLNRPDIFQGGLGAPIGLFQSYMWNFMQRNYRYLETGDFKTLGVQTAMQASMFGMTTIPGFAQFQSLINTVSSGEINPYDGIYARFDRNTADWITSGIPSNLPKLLGADDGFALSVRGDTNPRLPIISGKPPVFQLAAKFGKAVGQSLDTFTDGVPGIQGQQLMEIWGNAIPNRPIAGMVDLFLGAEVDDRGNVINNEIRSVMGVMARISGFKLQSEAKANEAFFANKNSNRMALAQRDKLNRASRAAIRAGNFDQLPGIGAEFLKRGGDPADLKNWMRGNFLAATSTRNERELMKIMGNVDKMQEITRLLNATRAIE